MKASCVTPSRTLSERAAGDVYYFDTSSAILGAADGTQYSKHHVTGQYDSIYEPMCTCGLDVVPVSLGTRKQGFGDV